MTAIALDTTSLRHALAAFPSGVTAVGAVIDGQPVGLAASSFTSLSLDPPLVSVAFARTSATWRQLRDVRHWGLNVLAAHHDAICRELAGPAADRFRNVPWTATDRGAIVIADAALTLLCTQQDVVPVGDHDLAVLSVERIERRGDTEPLLFHASRFRRVVG